MQGTMLIFKADGSDKQVRELDRAPELAELKAALDGGWIESVPYFTEIEYRGKWRKCWAICDEEGKLKKLDINPRATLLWEKTLTRHGMSLRLNDDAIDVLCGPVCVLFGDEEFMQSL